MYYTESLNLNTSKVHGFYFQRVVEMEQFVQGWPGILHYGTSCLIVIHYATCSRLARVCLHEIDSTCSITVITAHAAVILTVHSVCTCRYVFCGTLLMLEYFSVKNLSFQVRYCMCWLLTFLTLMSFQIHNTVYGIWLWKPLQSLWQTCVMCTTQTQVVATFTSQTV